MPRETIEIPRSLEHLSILDEEGSVDPELEPDLSDELLLRMYDEMLLARLFDERMLSLQRQGRIGTFAPVRGQEAAQVGSVTALHEEDWVVPSYREIAVAISRGLPMEGMLLYNAGYNEGGAIPDEAHYLPNSVPVGSQMLHAAGIAYGLRVRGGDEVVMTYFGDGATSEGDFHEALNFAAVFDCPCVFVCQNNQYAISVPREHQTRSRTLAQKALAYGIPCVQVDGNDVLAVHVAAQEAVERAREEHVPTLIECVTYRLGVHTTVDDPSKYREEEEVEDWKDRDPLPRFQAYLEERELLDERRVGRSEGAAEEAIAAAVERWEQQMAEAEGPALMFDHVYAESTPDLEAQREELLAQWPERREAQRAAESASSEEEQEQEADEAEERAQDDASAEDEAAEDGAQEETADEEAEPEDEAEPEEEEARNG